MKSPSLMTKRLPYSAPLSMYEKAEMLEKEIMAHTHHDELWQLITDQINDDFSVRYAYE